MTQLFFVRHAQPQHSWKDDRTRPLTDEGMQDTNRVLEFFRDVPPDIVYSSPYRRSMDTIKSVAKYWCKEIHTDERLRERESGVSGTGRDMIAKRWADLDWHEPGGESIHMVQKRNITAIMEILEQNPGKTVMIGTHGTALSSVLHYFESDFGCGDFFRLMDWMPYIVELDFEGKTYLGQKEHLFLPKPFEVR
ncbi:MAG: histidine phosphatase family protein [Candidatus Merdivicinus sp.]|jgi:2,3-bisphosphoglycerate-dependent phosphoglycerate mutase